MKKITGIMAGSLLMLAAVLYSADTDQQAVEFVKNCLERLKMQYAYTAALRYFQYTATTSEQNPYSYVLEANDDSVLAEANLTKADRGRYIAVLRDRSGARITKLWKEHKQELFAMVNRDVYKNNFEGEVNSLINFHDSKGYRANINTLRKKSPKLNSDTMERAGEITQWNGYKELCFWYRRTAEKNDKAVYDILKEIQANYK